MNKTPIEIAALVFGTLLIIGLFLAYHPTMMNAAKGMGYRVVSLFGPEYTVHRYSYGDGDRMHGSQSGNKPASHAKRTPIAPSPAKPKAKPAVKPSKTKKPTKHDVKPIAHKPSTKPSTEPNKPAKKTINNKPATNNKPAKPSTNPNAKPSVHKPKTNDNQPAKPAFKPSKPIVNPHSKNGINPVTPVEPKKPSQPAKPKAKPATKPSKPNKPAVKPQPKKPVTPAKPKVIYENERVIFLNTDKKPFSTQTVRGKKGSVDNVNAPNGYEYMNGKYSKSVTINGNDLAVEVQSVKVTDKLNFIDNHGKTVGTANVTGARGTAITSINPPTHYRVTGEPKFSYDGGTHDVSVKENVVTNTAKVFDYDTGKQVGMSHPFTGLAGTREHVSIPSGYHLVENTDNDFTLSPTNGKTIKIVIEKTRPPFGYIKAKLEPMPGTRAMPGITSVISRGRNERPFRELGADKHSIHMPYRVAKVTGTIPTKYYGGETQKFIIWYEND